jgi:hypothetical protein
MKETLKEANYTYLSYHPRTQLHFLKNNDTDIIEVFAANKNHASWGLIYKNTHLEFLYSIHPSKNHMAFIK